MGSLEAWRLAGRLDDVRCVEACELLLRFPVVEQGGVFGTGSGMVRDVKEDEALLPELAAAGEPTPALCGGLVKTLDSFLAGGVPTVKSSVKSWRWDDCCLRN